MAKTVAPTDTQPSAITIDSNWQLGLNVLMAAARRKSGAHETSARGGDSHAAPTNAVFTIDDLVAYLKLPKSTVYKLAQEGVIPGHKVGRHWRFHKAVIDRWLGNDERESGTASEGDDA